MSSGAVCTHTGKIGVQVHSSYCSHISSNVAPEQFYLYVKQAIKQTPYMYYQHCE